MAIEEYSKRLGRYVTFDIIEVADEKAPEHLSEAQEEQIRLKEGERLMKVIRPEAYVIALEITGKTYSSEEFSALMENCMGKGISHICFVIGGSIGLSKEIHQRSNLFISFSKMTFPHQLMRVILSEQIYRGIKIMKHEPYHK